jgi:hypothetical protein
MFASDCDQDGDFWERISEESLKSNWDNAEDDVYRDLLEI